MYFFQLCNKLIATNFTPKIEQHFQTTYCLTVLFNYYKGQCVFKTLTLRRSCVFSCQAFDLECSWRWPCCDRDQYLFSMITIESDLHLKSSEVCIITRSTLASLLFKGLATKHTTVKWTIKVDRSNSWISPFL